jgi:hypothetical protein
MNDIFLQNIKVSQFQNDCAREKERTDTEDVFYTAFKGMRTDRKFRRRLDFKNVKRIISYAVEILNE